MELYRSVFERRFVIRERSPDISGFAGESTLDLDDGQDVLLRLVQRGDDFLPGQYHRIGTVDPTLDLDEAQVMGARIAGGDVVSHFLCRHIAGLIVQRAFCRHHGYHCFQRCASIVLGICLSRIP